MLRCLRRAILPALLVGSLAANVLSFASSAFVGLVSSAASMAGLSTVQARQGAQRERVARRIAQRTARGAARSVAGLGPQALPWIGAASVAGFTAWEIADACATLDDLAELMPGATRDADASQEAARLCGLNAAELRAFVAAQLRLTAPPQADSPEDAHSGEP